MTDFGNCNCASITVDGEYIVLTQDDDDECSELYFSDYHEAIEDKLLVNASQRTLQAITSLESREQLKVNLKEAYLTSDCFYSSILSIDCELTEAEALDLLRCLGNLEIEPAVSISNQAD